MTVIQLKTKSLNQMMDEFHRQFSAAQDSDKKAYGARLKAGEILKETRARIEAGEAGEGVKWWDWFADNSVRSRKDAEKLLGMVNAEDPQAAHEEEREKGRARDNARNAARSRGRQNSQSVDEAEDEQEQLVATALRLVDRMDAGHRQQFVAELMRKIKYEYQD